jgi:TRAP-type C4-dicarboxylate transport system substrate-binding protein
MFAALDGELGEYFANRMRNHGMYILAWHDPGTRSFYNSVRPIYTPSDLEGLRIRVQETELMMGLITMLGGSPVPMPWGEVYTAIQTGVIDGAENNWPSFITAAHYEVARYFTVSEHSIMPEPIIVNLNAWESISPEMQEIVRQAAIDGAAVQRAEWLISEQENMQLAIESGTQVTHLTEEQRAQFVELILPLYDQFSDVQYHIDMIINAQQ